MSVESTVPERTSAPPLKSLRVEVVTGPDSGKAQVATSDRIMIGTAPSNDLVLSDETVSRYHVELERRADRIVVHDLGSTNGTALGSAKLERATITPGSILKLGRTSVRVDDGDTVAIELYPDDCIGRVRGRTPEMRHLMAKISRAAQSNASVLLLGETGTGKEVIAHAIHEASSRAAGPFETVDCGTLMPTLIASELFGHEKGAFTGAERQHTGAFERADGGTLFLDEIGELPSALQSALLGALERRTFRRVGGSGPIHVDVRLISATHRDLRGEVNSGTFRQDLYYRIAVLLLRVPPLREHAGDIPLLVEHFLREAGHQGSFEEIVPESAVEAMRAYSWPGNVRELRNFVEATFALGEVPKFDEGTSAGAATASGASKEGGRPFPSIAIEELLKKSYKDARAFVIDELERIYFTALLQKTGGNITRAAHKAEMNRSYLNQVVRRLKIKSD